MTGKRAGWALAALAIALVALVSVGFAQEEKPQRVRRVIVLDGSGWLGVSVSNITAEKAQELKLPGEYGVLIESVHEDSPAAGAGLAENDVILEFAGERVRSVTHLRRLVRETPPGRTVALGVSRDGRTLSLEAKLEERSRARVEIPDIDIRRVAPRIQIPQFRYAPLGQRPRLGISGSELTEQLADYFGVQQGQGVLVREVLAGSAAEKAGVKAGDVIISLGEESIGSIRDLRRALARQRESEEVTLTIVRDRRQQTLVVKLDKPMRISPWETAWAWVDPEFWEHYAEEMAEAAKDWEQHLERWEEDFEQHHQDWETELEKHLREAERQIREHFESEEFRNKMEELEKKMRELKQDLVVL